MKKTKYLLLLLLFIFILLLSRCSSEKRAIKKAIADELNLLKKLDTETAMKYVSWQDLFPDIPENSENLEKIKELFALFFKDFDYKIQDIQIDKSKNTANATLLLYVMDGKSLAKDFALEKLMQEIKLSAQHNSTESIDVFLSEEKLYLLLYHLLKENEYGQIEITSKIQLEKDSQKEGTWTILRTASFEDDLVGGLVTFFSDVEILSPEETLSGYLNSITEMNIEEMIHYLDIESIINTSDNQKNKIASALVQQMHQHFQYQILSVSREGTAASVETQITTFDTAAILDSFQKQWETYLSTPEAVMEGEETRYQKSYEILLESIQNNTATIQLHTTFQLFHDGMSWQLDDTQHDLGNAIFGNAV